MGKLEIKSMVEVELNPLELFENGGVGKAVARIRAEVGKLVFDVYTEKGRKELKSLKYKVSRSKTLLDKCRKEYVAGRKAEIKVIDEAGRKMCIEMDELRDSIGKPLDQWEEEQTDIRIKQEVAESWDEAQDLNDQYDADIRAEKAREAKIKAERIAQEKKDHQNVKDREKELIAKARKDAEKAAKIRAEEAAGKHSAELDKEREKSKAALAKVMAEKKSIPDKEIIDLSTLEDLPPLEMKKIRKYTIEALASYGVKKKVAKQIFDAAANNEFKYLKVDYHA